ncbi:hypothetical protein BG015_001367 [Linnemannia schmuckeri]|uniref:AAA+ ATPase domain-containing protein n=1 Tax=Linnemannia schmuckeri TaxID=64567 RepID=A0A9P5RTB8_9FUNG|nr:hypothetical protein BG015_001367 [Linnemannia schmuckeri]
MDERAIHANEHAARAKATRHLPLISASHHRALLLLLSTEANDVHLTPQQRKNARTLQEHYHRQYLETCVHKDPLAPPSTATTTTATASGASSGGVSLAGRRIIDRVNQKVNLALNKKSITRKFTSAVNPNERNMSDYTMCLEDLAALTCQPELDLLPMPESLKTLQERSNQYEEEAARTAAKAEEAARVAAEAEAATLAKEAKAKEEAAAAAAQEALQQETAATKSARTGSTTPPEVVMRPVNEGKNGSIKSHPHDSAAITLSRTQRNQPSHATIPPPVPSTARPTYVIYGDEEDDDDRSDPVPVPDYRPVANNFSNGIDRNSKKRTWNDRSDAVDYANRPTQFITAKEQLAIEEQQQEEKKANHYMHRGGFTSPANNLSTAINNNSMNGNNYSNGNSNSTLKSKILGTKRPKFKSPINRTNSAETNDEGTKMPRSANGAEEPVDDRLKNIDPKMIESIKNEIMESYAAVTWEDISGLEHAKKTIKETITWPMLRPEIFTGLRRPPKGLLLFGPPGTGKTMIGKCIASQSKATFFSISSSSLTSKWVGDGEKMVRALFAVARCHQPAVIFMDEIDSLLTQRTDGEVEASRRIKTEFLVQFDGVGVGGEEDRILIVGATNRPQEIDEAARRRFQKRLYIPLPEYEGRLGLMNKLLESQPHELTEDQIKDICERTAGYSGSDMTGLCREAALGPVRAIQGDILEIALDDLRPINHGDFLEALSQVRASVSDRDLDLYKEWDQEYGSMAKGS